MALQGIDISSNNPKDIIDLVSYDFCIIKVGGNPNQERFSWSYINPYWKDQAERVLSQGKHLGLYWFLFGRDSATEEADKFVSEIQGFIGKALLVADYEMTALSKGTVWLKQFMDRVYSKTGIRPLVYCSKSVLREQDFSAIAQADYGLWFAQYANNNTTGYLSEPWTDNQGLGAFSSAALQQYTSSGRLDGYSGNLDLNIFYGTSVQWNAYGNVSGESSSMQNSGSKSTTQLAQEVIQGDWGNGEDRKKRLEAEGYDYNAVQAKVNELVG